MNIAEQLYETFHPDTYTLNLTLKRVAREFYGTVEITGSYEGSKPLQLHSKQLEIIEAHIDGQAIQTHSGENDQLVFDTSIEAGNHVISLRFKGKITDPMHGLYPCYFEHNGIKKELLATQFESHHAREVFPCIDEPEAKAIFNLTLTTEKDVTVLANMPVSSQTSDSDSLTTAFEPSPRMSSYLLAFVAGELHKKSALTKSGVEVNVWATPAQQPESLDFGLSTAVRSIEFFDDYFGVSYPLPKCDHVALPDFTVGAMENWGLITYREVCLLADENTAIGSRQRIAEVIAHETSHQWFGNLVTMKWWNDLWLNESFATFMSYACVDYMFPSWDIWMTFATNETLSAMRRDYLPTVQSVRVDVHHPDEISTLFDPSIVYAKGARLLAMLHSYIGNDTFRTGLAHYFRTYSYRNTTAQHLWKSLSLSSEHDITQFMTPWLEQPGLPIIHIDKKALRQERFVLGGANPTPDALWPVPLASNQASLPDLLETREASYTFKSDETKINVGGKGHFITHYANDDMLASRIAAIADGSEEDPADRLTLLNDASLLARSGNITAADLFDLAQAYQNETSEPVWDIIALVISDLKRFVETSPHQEKKFKQQVAKLSRGIYEKLGWDMRSDETESDTKLRAIAISMLVYADDETVIKKGLAAFHTTQNPANLPGELRTLIFAIAAIHGTDEDFQRLIDIHESTQIAELQRDVAAGLTGARDETRIARLIDMLGNDRIVRLQDTTFWFVCLIRNRHAREQTWQWLVTHWQWISDRFSSDMSYDNFVRYSASGLSTYEWLERYNKFFQPKKDITALTRAIELGISDITARAEWIKRDKTTFLESL